MFWPNAKIVVFVAHPDDEVLGLGAAMRKWTLAGCDVQVVVATDGGYPSYAPALLAARRQASITAAELLGHRVEFLDLPDLSLETLATRDLQPRLRERLTGKDVVLSHFGADANPDHAVLSRWVKQCLREGSVRLFAEFETPSSTDRAGCFGAPLFQPNCWVDVSKTIDDKIQAFALFQSEQQPLHSFRSSQGLRDLAAVRGAAIRVAAAECLQIHYCRC